jgi:hypothetical protein
MTDKSEFMYSLYRVEVILFNTEIITWTGRGLIVNSSVKITYKFTMYFVFILPSFINPTGSLFYQGLFSL